MSAIPRTKLTPDEYLEFERKFETKHKYFNGEVFAMSGKNGEISAAHIVRKADQALGYNCLQIRLKIEEGK